MDTNAMIKFYKTRLVFVHLGFLLGFLIQLPFLYNDINWYLFQGIGFIVLNVFILTFCFFTKNK